MVPAVEVETAAVLEKHASVAHAGHRLLEDIADDVLPCRETGPVDVAEEAVLGLEPEDAPHECSLLESHAMLAGDKGAGLAKGRDH